MTEKVSVALRLGRLPKFVGFHLRMAQAMVFKDFEQALAGLDVTPAIFGMLEILSHNKGLTQTRLAVAMGLGRSSLVPLLNKLQKRKLVEREVSTGDRRRNILHLKFQGEQLLAEVTRRVVLHEQSILAELSKSDAKLLIALLMKLESARALSTASIAPAYSKPNAKPTA